MNYRSILWSCLSMAFFSACQQAETVKLEGDDLRMSIVASIENQSFAPKSRLTGTGPSDVAFGEKDQIGVFVGESALSKWTFESSGWLSVGEVFWPDKTSEHTFHAFFPYASDASLRAVPMPDLSGQDGTFECIKSRDFLIASVTQAFGDNGVVDFQENPFRHFSSLLKLTISPNGDLSDTKLTKIQITGEDITSRTTYSFLSETTQVVSKSNDWTIALNDVMSDGEAEYYALLNPVTCSSGVTLLIEYEREGEFYVATKEGFASNAFSGGVMQEFTIVVKDGVLTISGAGISEWGEGAELDDLIINGEKQEE